MEMLNDETKRQAAGAALRRTAAEKYSLHRMIDEIDDLYLSIKS
jgi:hypothetical protein